jgi:hypothetical protein
MEQLKVYIRRSVITPLVTLIVLFVYGFSALKIAPPLGQDGILSESFFPLLIFLLAAPVSVKMLFDAVKAVQKEQSDNKKNKPRSFNIKPVLVGLIILFLALGLNPLGYVIVAPVFVFLFMLIYDDKPQGILKKILFTILITILVYVLYEIVFDIQFPEFWR